MSVWNCLALVLWMMIATGTAVANDDKVALAAGVTGDLTGRIKAGDLMREFAQRLGGKGGGRPDMAQGGGTDVNALKDVLGDVPQWVGANLS